MDAGVVANFRPKAYASRMAAERVKTGAKPPGAFEISRLPVARATAAAEGRAGPSAASALLSDAPWHRPRRASLHPAQRRSQRRLTPFFSNLLALAKRILAAVLVGGAAALAAAEQSAVFRARGADARLFDQYDNDGYSLEVSAGANGSVELRVRVSDSPLASTAPFPTRERSRAARVAAPDRDAFARDLAAGSQTEAQAVQRILLGLAARVAYDPDRLRRQDPGAVFSSGRAYCVGFAELAVDLLGRAGISARTVQGVLATEPGADGYEARIGGAFHRWIEVYYPDRGYVFSDPVSSVNGVDARYVAFSRRAWTRPQNLALTALSRTGELSYPALRVGNRTIRIRATTPESAAR